MPWPPAALSLRNQVAHRALLDDRVHRDPLVVAQRRDRRPLQRRQQREDRRRDRRARTFSISPTRPCASIAALQQQRDVLELRALPRDRPAPSWLAMSCVFDSITVSMMRSRLARSVDPVSVASTIASASTGGLTSVAPHENSTLTVHALALEVRAASTRTSSVAIVLPSRSCGDLERASLPARPAPSAPCRSSAWRRSDRRSARATPVVPSPELVLGDPVLAGEAGVEDAVGDVARHLLRADQHALDLGIVDRRESTSAS